MSIERSRPRLVIVDTEVDLALHIVEVCPVWSAERALLIEAVDGDLSLSALVEAMLSEVRSHERSPLSMKLLCFGRRRPKEYGSKVDPIGETGGDVGMGFYRPPSPIID